VPTSIPLELGSSFPVLVAIAILGLEEAELAALAGRELPIVPAVGDAHGAAGQGEAIDSEQVVVHVDVEDLATIADPDADPSQVLWERRVEVEDVGSHLDADVAALDE